jgi:hypothetical protein
MKIWIASDCTRGQYYTIPETREQLDPIAVAYKYGRAEFGEIISIYYDENDETPRLPDADVYWDSIRREYRKN